MKKYLTFIIVLPLIFSSCSKKEMTLNHNIIVLGHGGMGIGQTYPMNTFESVLTCLNSGTDGSEIDVQLTKDGVLVAYHGQDLSDETNLSGVINDYNWSEIKNVFYTSSPYLKYSILSLDQLFANVPNLNDYKFSFDCKLYKSNNAINFKEAYINSLSEIIAKYDLKSNVYIESQDTNFLMKLKEKDPDYKLFIYPSSFENGLATALDLDLYGITISTKKVTREQIEEAHSNNLKVAIWNTHSKNKNIKGVDKNPDFIQTDKVKYLVSLLK